MILVKNSAGTAGSALDMPISPPQGRSDGTPVGPSSGGDKAHCIQQSQRSQRSF